jgi:hypothetical protein
MRGSPRDPHTTLAERDTAERDGSAPSKSSGAISTS